MMLVQEYGRSWSQIAKLMKKNRTRYQVKNRYNSQMNRKSAIQPELQHIHFDASQYQKSSIPVMKEE